MLPQYLFDATRHRNRDRVTVAEAQADFAPRLAQANRNRMEIAAWCKADSRDRGIAAYMIRELRRWNEQLDA